MSNHHQQSQAQPRKRDELQELKLMLKRTAGQRSTKEILKKRLKMFEKLIQLIAQGIDCQEIFDLVILNSSDSDCDVRVKKMLYFYFEECRDCDLVILAINTLQKDIENTADATIRGLAIRSITSLGNKDIVQYLIEAVKVGLKDENAYPRKIACLGCLKIARLLSDDEELMENSGLLQKLEELLMEDTDANVVANALTTISEIYGENDSRLTNVKMISALVKKIRDFGELQQHLVCKLVYNYAKNNANLLDDSVKFEWMNELESRVSSPNSAIALAASRAFLELTKTDFVTHQKVYQRIKPSLLTLATAQTSGQETSSVVWAHLRLLAMRVPILFCTDYKSFYVRAQSDSFTIKKLKVKTLALIADQHNYEQIVLELLEYCDDVDETFSSLALNAIGSIARHQGLIEEARVRVTQKICELLLTKSDTTIHNNNKAKNNIRAESLHEIGLVLRTSSISSSSSSKEEEEKLCCEAISKLLEHFHFSVPDIFPSSQSSFSSNDDFCDEIAGFGRRIMKARISLIWILGEFGEKIALAPYALETLVENLSEEINPSIRLETFASCVKLFLKRAPEMRNIFEECLISCAKDIDPRVRNYSRIHGNACLSDPRLLDASSVKTTTKTIGGDYFAEEMEEKERFQKLFEEIDTLSIMYEMCGSKFTNYDNKNNGVSSRANNNNNNNDEKTAHKQALDQETSLLSFEEDIDLI